MSQLVKWITFSSKLKNRKIRKQVKLVLFMSMQRNVKIGLKSVETLS